MTDPTPLAQPFEPAEPLTVTSDGGSFGRWFWDNQTTIGRHAVPGQCRFISTIAHHRALVLF